MNKYQKANEWIGTMVSNPDWGHCSIDWEAVDEIEEALSIVTPNKIVLKENKYGSNDACCPNCNCVLAKNYIWKKEEEVAVDFCPKCGQRLEW